MSNPLDEYFETRKEASFWKRFVEPQTSLGRDVRSTALTVGTTVGMMAAVPAAQKLMGAITKRHDFNKMMEANPHLRDEQAANPKAFNQMYSSLRRMNPEFAKDPIVAGGLMSRMGDDPEAASSILMEAQRYRKDPSASPMQQAMVGTVRGGFGRDADRPEAPVDPFAAQKERIEGMRLGVQEHEFGQKMKGIGEARKQMNLPGL